MTPTARRILVALLVAVVALTGCGGGDDDGGGGGGDAASDVGTADDGDGGGPGLFTASRCAEVAADMARAAGAVQQAITGTVGELERSVEAMRAAADEAPDEIRDDFRLLAEGYARALEAFAGFEWDPAGGEPPPQEALAAMERVGQELDSEEYRTANERVSAWFEDNCGR